MKSSSVIDWTEFVTGQSCNYAQLSSIQVSTVELFSKWSYGLPGNFTVQQKLFHFIR